MYADVKGSLEQIDKSWRFFKHNGKKMSKKEVEAVLLYALSQGYVTTQEITDKEIEEIIFKVKYQDE